MSQVNKTGSSGPIYPKHLHSFKVLSSALHTIPVVCAKVQSHFDSRIETMHGALNLLLLRGPDWEKTSTQPTFLWWGRTTERHMETSRDWMGDGLEPGCSSSLERWQWSWLCRHWRYPQGEGSYWCPKVRRCWRIDFITSGRTVSA